MNINYFKVFNFGKVFIGRGSRLKPDCNGCPVNKFIVNE